MNQRLDTLGIADRLEKGDQGLNTLAAAELRRLLDENKEIEELRRAMEIGASYENERTLLAWVGAIHCALFLMSLVNIIDYDVCVGSVGKCTQQTVSVK